MKKLINWLLVLILAFGCIGLVACDNDDGSEATEEKFEFSLVTDGDEKYALLKNFEISSEDATAVSEDRYADLMVDIEIKETECVVTDKDGNTRVYPATINGKTYSIKEIGESAFANLLVIKSMIIPDTVQEIGSACLAGCTNLQSLTIPYVGNKVDALNDGKTLGYLFGTTEVDGCSSTSVYYNASGSKTYYIPASLKTVTVTGNNNINDYAFYGFNYLETINVSNAITSIGNNAFYGCTSLANFTLPISVEIIGENAFKNCTTLINVGFATASSLKKIYNGAFSGCTNLAYNYTESVLKITNSIEKIYDNAFYGCTSIVKLDLSDASNLTTICSSAFSGCSKLKTVVFDSVVNASLTIEAQAFTDCDLLTSVQNRPVNAVTGAFDFDLE